MSVDRGAMMVNAVKVTQGICGDMQSWVQQQAKFESHVAALWL
jgi:hypothetical protein